MLEAFPFDTAPKYLLRDRDRIYGQEFRKQVEIMNIMKSLVLRDLPGSALTWNASSARSGENAWTM